MERQSTSELRHWLNLPPRSRSEPFGGLSEAARFRNVVDELTVYDERLTSLDETFSSHLVLTRFLIRLGVNARRFKLRIKEGDDATLQLARS